MRKIIIVISLVLSISLMTSCASKTNEAASGNNSEPVHNKEASDELNDGGVSYTEKASLNEINYSFYYPKTESYTSSTYGWSVGNGNSEKIATVIYSPASSYFEASASNLDEAMTACEPYIAETIRDAIRDFSAEEDLSALTKESITTSNGIEMLKTVGVYKGEEFGNLEYTAYYFLDGDKPVYVLAYPKDMSGLKSCEPQFDYLVDQFVQHITKEG